MIEGRGYIINHNLSNPKFVNLSSDLLLSGTDAACRTRVNNRISDTRLNRTPAQQIQETWRRGLSMITYLSPYEACTPAMTIEVPLVLVWQARIHAVRTHRCSDVLTIRRTGGMSMPQVNFLCSYVECSYCPKRDAFDL